MKRLLYLDNLKVYLTVLVIFHHAGQAYGDGGDWAYTPSNPAEVMPWIWHFFSVNAAFFMGLFFLISGYFVPASYDKQGASIFVQKKLIRLGIPLLVMGGLCSASTSLYFACSLVSGCSGCFVSTEIGTVSSGSGVPPRLTEPTSSIYY
jgi:fucose 4-O-acetylase-like acetyltransferase